MSSRSWGRVALLVMFASIAPASLSACGSPASNLLFSSAGGSAVNHAGAGNNDEKGGATGGVALAESGAGGNAEVGGVSALGGSGNLGSDESGGAATVELGTDAGAGGAEAGADGSPTTAQGGVSGSLGGGSNAAGRGGNSGKSCAGHAYSGICWYLSDFGESCDGVCSDHGEYAAQATRLIGTPAQGGSVDSCKAVLSALGVPALLVTVGVRANDDQGLGCHLFGTPSVPWWLSDPPFSPFAFNNNAHIACGCTE